MNERDFFIVTAEVLTNISDELANTNYGLVKDHVEHLSKVITDYKKTKGTEKVTADESKRSIEVYDTVKNVISEKLGVGAHVGAHTYGINARLIEDLGADSLDLVELIMAFEDHYEIVIPDEDGMRIKTVKDTVDYLIRKI